MKIDIVASQPHYLDHMRPIFEALPDEMRGLIYAGADPWAMVPRGQNRIVMVAGWQDVRYGRGRMIYVEHGAGQSYAGDPKTATQPGYPGAGAMRHRGVIGYIAPSEGVADRWRIGTKAPVAAVGCPKLDRWIGVQPAEPKMVCLTFHWDCLISPEARSAYPHYAEAIPKIISKWEREGWVVAAHVHPRWEGRLDSWLESSGALLLPRDVDVFEMASCMVVDNSSIGAEMLALGRPVVWLNAPWYRRHTWHGGRFWDWTRTLPSVDGPGDLLAAKLGAIMSFATPEVVASVADSIYAHRDGRSAERAAAFIVDLATPSE